MLNLELARRAHNANSYREFNGERIQASFNAEVSEAVQIGEQQKQRLAKLYPGVDLSEEYAKIDRLVNSFSGRLEDHYNKGFAIEASCPSLMIAGGSNFPTRKKEKQNAARGRHNEEYKEIKSIIDSIKAVGTSIRGNDENAVDKLQVKIAQLKAEQTRAKAMNAYYRKNGTVKGFDGVTDDEAERIDTDCVDLIKAISIGVSGGTVNKKIIADCWDAFLHGNTRSERQAERLDGSDTIAKGKLRLEEGRINIYFNGKPDADTISKLKSKAFKWSPSRMAWTRQDTPNARYAVKDLLISGTQQTQETEKPSVLEAIRANKKNPISQGVNPEKSKKPALDER